MIRLSLNIERKINMEQILDRAEQYGKLAVLYKTVIFLQKEIKKEEERLKELKREEKNEQRK